MHIDLVYLEKISKFGGEKLIHEVEQIILGTQGEQRDSQSPKFGVFHQLRLGTVGLSPKNICCGPCDMNDKPHEIRALVHLVPHYSFSNLLGAWHYS